MALRKWATRENNHRVHEALRASVEGIPTLMQMSNTQHEKAMDYSRTKKWDKTFGSDSFGATLTLTLTAQRQEVFHTSAEADLTVNLFGKQLEVLRLGVAAGTGCFKR